MRGLRVAFCEDVFFDDANEEVAALVRATGEVFRHCGAHVDSMPFPQARQAMQLNPKGLAVAAEAYTLNRKLIDDHFDELDPIVAFRMVKGRDIAAHEYFDMERKWTALRESANAELADVDALLCPTVMIPALPVAGIARDTEKYSAVNLQCLRNTAIGNVLNLCAVTVPCGFTKQGLPVGLMIYGKSFDEETVLRIALAYQGATDWHKRMPDLGWI